jgi:hypothetical protein
MKPNTKWSDLPNAHHIDWVLASLKDNPDLWTAASNIIFTARAAARGTVWYATWTSARGTAWAAAYNAARTAAYNAAWAAAEWSRPRRNEWASAEAAARGTAWDSAWYAARDAILALVAYDDCDQYLSMSYEELTIWAVLSEHPAAILLLPMIYVREKIQESELVS